MSSPQLSAPLSARVRLWRAAWLSAWAIALASAGHQMAGGHSPAPFVLVLTAAVVGFAAWSAGARTLSWPRAAAVLISAQALLHLLTVWSMPGVGSAASGAHAGMAGMDQGALALNAGAASHAPMQMSALMLGAHLVAALLSAALMASADGRAAQGLRMARHALTRFVIALPQSRPVVVRTGGPAISTSVVAHLREQVRLSCAGPRAPPLPS